MRQRMWTDENQENSIWKRKTREARKLSDTQITGQSVDSKLDKKNNRKTTTPPTSKHPLLISISNYNLLSMYRVCTENRREWREEWQRRNCFKENRVTTHWSNWSLAFLKAFSQRTQSTKQIAIIQCIRHVCAHFFKFFFVIDWTLIYYFVSSFCS